MKQRLGLLEQVRFLRCMPAQQDAATPLQQWKSWQKLPSCWRLTNTKAKCVGQRAPPKNILMSEKRLARIWQKAKLHKTATQSYSSKPKVQELLNS